MEKYHNGYDKEVMKATMMRHEETFKEQVFELHRLYRIQKTLMKSATSNGVNRQFPDSNWRSNNGLRYQKHSKKNLGLEIPLRDNSNGSNCGQIGENEIVLTLGLAPPTYTSRTYQSSETPTPRSSESFPSFSSSSSGSSRINKMLGECNPREMADGVHDMEDRLNRERLRQPSWLIKVLSL